MADDACNIVKTDIQAGTPTRHTTDYPIYIQDEDEFEGTPDRPYVILKDADREPLQTIANTVLFTYKSCTIEIYAPTTTIRDNIYLDIIDILNATSRSYKLMKGRDLPHATDIFTNSLKVRVIN